MYRNLKKLRLHACMLIIKEMEYLFFTILKGSLQLAMTFKATFRLKIRKERLHLIGQIVTE